LSNSVLVFNKLLFSSAIALLTITNTTRLLSILFNRSILPIFGDYFRLSLLCCRPDGLELSTRQSPRPGSQQQQLQATT